MVIEYADRVEEIDNLAGGKVVRLTRFVTGMSANTTNETTIPMCSEDVQGPEALFVENMNGKTVQRIKADVPFPMPPEQPA
jgi:hypothetical protein